MKKKSIFLDAPSKNLMGGFQGSPRKSFCLPWAGFYQIF